MELDKLLYKIQLQYKWRPLYKECHDFVNGNQFTSKQLETAKRLNIEPKTFNLISAPIETLQGTEIKTRVDYLLSSRNSESENGTTALNAELNRVEKTTKMNKAISKAFFSSVVGGCGFIRFGRNPYVGDKYSCEAIPVENVYWDMQRDNFMFDRSEWVTIRSVYGVDEAAALYPEHKKEIKAQMHNSLELGNGGDISFQQGYDQTFRNDLINTENDTVTIHEVFYKKHKTIEIFEGMNGEQYGVNDLTKEHKKMLRLQKKTFKKIKTDIWRCVFVGFVKIDDSKAKQPHNAFPIVPIWGEITNTYNTPRGKVANMLDPQKDYNHYKLEISTIMGHKNISYEDGSLKMSQNEVANEGNRRDSIWKYKTGSQPPSITKELAELREAEALLIIAKQEIRECSGLTNSFTGDAEGLSGKAIVASSELATQSVVGLFDARDDAKVKLGEIAMAHIIDDIGNKETELLTENNHSSVQINSHTEQGDVLNPIGEIRFNIQLSSIKTSAGFKQLQSNRIVAMAHNAKEPTIQAILQLTALDLEDVPNKDKILPLIHKKLGLEALSNDPDAQEQHNAQAMQAAQQQADLEQQKITLALEQQQAENNLKNQEAMLKMAQTKKILSEIQMQSNQSNLEKEFMASV